MASIRGQFEVTGRMRTWSMGLIAVGLLAFLIGLFTRGFSSNAEEQGVFWGTVLYNSVFFMLVCNASMFFICVTTLAHGGWQVAFRRVPEAISAVVPIFGTIAAVVLLYIVFGVGHGGHHHPVYHWLTRGDDQILAEKKGFLNAPFFVIWTLLSIGLWSYLGARMRKLSRESDEGSMTLEQGKRWIWRNTVMASLFTVWFGLTVGSTVPWLWMMSIDAHWYSTMYSWYTFASSFVSGVALIALWVIFLKNRGLLEYVTEEHLHDLGKFMFAFSIFWTYLWFSQYMLIWYSNMPEETIYFKHRVQGAWRGVFFFNLIVNFVCPLLILMKRSTKRNYTLMTFMAVLILFGHWIDFMQMVMGSVSKDHLTLSWLDFGILALYIGMIILFVGKALTKAPLVAKNHPYLKESIIHHT
ncbi:quinol:cytochrome C oxidoreductase [Segetibacter sp. 3557_3]|uniref:quinol:cytochrome C oxidoreductase n=1 Tax=Segetibacter sp. 3557_3 TaxID=2547429 RepID=UPI001058896E|nr:quinol:cytochrome C oxidoreductase [Segetibacter sp. 3557_3]TDH24027.1 quinol:cytochrome C oxidoreductase [Segetibacter sp. 3557_3]